MPSRTIVFASPPEPSGASWLVNCFLELGIKVRYEPVLQRVWRNARPRPPPDHMWRESGGLHVLHPKAHVLQKWLPALTRVEGFSFRRDVVVDYVQDLARGEPPDGKAVFFVRDPRDAIYSMYRRMQSELSFDQFVEFRDPDTLLDRIDQWVLRVNAWADTPRVGVFRFEDYKRDAEAVLCEVLDWLELSAHPADVARAVAESTFEKARAAEAEYKRKHPGDTEIANRAGKMNDWMDRQLGDFGVQVEQRAGDTLRRFGYAVEAARDRGSNAFRGAAQLRSLAFLRDVRIPDELQRIAADPRAIERSANAVATFASSVDADLLERSRLAPDEIRRLLDSLRELGAARGLDLGPHLAELRQRFEDGSAYHFERLRHLLGRVREARDT